MKSRIAVALALPIIGALAACGKPPAREPLKDAPVIHVFAAEKAELQPGESTRLRYTVSGATSVAIVDGTGAELEVEGTETDGELEVTPEQTALYVLRAVGPGGRAAAFAQVAVGEALATVFLAAVPPEVDPGETVDLAWSAQGAVTVTLKDDGGVTTTLDGQRGVFSFVAEQTRSFTLSAVGPDLAVKEATAQVKVRPRIDLLTLAPGVIQAGEPVLFKWETRGAELLVIEEKTFGQLHATDVQGEIAADQFEWTVPLTDPVTQAPLLDGHRMEFTVKVSAATTGTVLTRTFVRHIGHGPAILLFDAPEFATPGLDVAFSWRVTGAERVQLFANGLLVYEPRGSDPDTLGFGAARVKSPVAATRYELVVSGFGGAVATASRLVELTDAPVITGFNLSEVINDAGDAATAAWTTEKAAEVQIRVKNGPVVFSSRNGQQVSNGTTALFPGNTTTYVLDAINAAGDLVSLERRVEVANPALVTVTPKNPRPGETVTVAWDLPQGDLQEVMGVLHPDAEAVPQSGQFIDLAGIPASRQLFFATGDDDVSQLPAWLAFRFPFAGQLRSTFHVSTNGFLALEPTQTMPDNSPIPLNADSASTGIGTRQWLPAMLAPLWDDLELGDGQVLFHVVGTEFPRRLVVQWEGVRLKDRSDSELTFQVQLLETGEVRFVYKTLEGGAGGPADAGATIGISGAGFEAAYAVNQGGMVDADTELRWFNSVMGQESFSLPLYSSTRFAFFYRRTNGSVVTVNVPVTMWGKDALLVNEAMPQPIAALGHWVELVNTTREELDLTDAELQVDSTNSLFTFPPGMILQPGQRLVVGASDDPFDNGGVSVGLVVDGFAIGAADTLSLLVDGVEVSSLAWTASTPAESVERRQWVLNDAKVDKVCPRATTFGNLDEKGTPGAPGEPCWDYLLENIAYDPVDILGSGKVEMQVFVNNPRWRVVQLDQPATLFGRAYEEVLLSSHGFISFDFLPWPHLSNGALSNYSYSPDKAPKPIRPNASVVPYGAGWWMHLTTIAQRADLAVMWRRLHPGELGPGSPGQYVFHWNRLSHLNDSTGGTATRTDATFQVRLFDDGVVEMHIGRMMDGSATGVQGLSEGLLGPSWLENPSGTEALVINLASREPGVRSYSGYRFTPAQ